MARYEKLEQQGMGSREALKFLSKELQSKAQEGEDVESYPMTTVEPGDEVDPAKLKEKAMRAHELTQQDLIRRLRSAQLTAIQGRFSREFGDAATTQLYAKADVSAVAGLISLPRIFGGISLALLIYILFFRKKVKEN